MSTPLFLYVIFFKKDRLCYPSTAKQTGCDKLFYSYEVVIVVKRLQDLGERAAIRQIQTLLSKGTQHRNIGDDCATIIFGKQYLLITTDMISQRTHIPTQMTPYQMGWFLVAINLSDIAAKGGTPLGVLCAFGLPKTTKETFFRELTKGANACAVQYSTTIVGGDTKETTEITLSGTAVGIVNKNEFMPRKGASPGDIVAVTGWLGKAGLGYYAIQKNSKEKKRSKGLFEPQPRLKEGRLLAQTYSVTSSMDLSDGLSASLYQLQEINAVGFEINKEAVPLASGLNQRFTKQSGIDPYVVALHFGGDYELLVTIPPKKFERIKQTMRKHGLLLSPIGIVTKEQKILLIGNKKKKILPNKGYEHFKKHIF
jgi:thiamine-monophosphate kinase